MRHFLRQDIDFYTKHINIHGKNFVTKYYICVAKNGPKRA